MGNKTANKLSAAGWTRETTNVFFKDGYTALVQADGSMLVINPLGKRKVLVP